MLGPLMEGVGWTVDHELFESMCMTQLSHGLEVLPGSNSCPAQKGGEH